MKATDFYNMLDEKLASINKEVETRVSRFYSSENYVVVATKSYDPHTHEDIVNVMRQHGFALYDVGGNCEYYMLTFKK